MSVISKLEYYPNAHAAELRRANCVHAKNGVDTRINCRDAVGLSLQESDYWRVKRMIADLRTDLEKLISIVRSFDQHVQSGDPIETKTA